MTKAIHQFHRTWIEQCEATEGIRLRHGAESAFDYVVGEKLFSYAAAALNRQVERRPVPHTQALDIRSRPHLGETVSVGNGSPGSPLRT